VALGGRVLQRAGALLDQQALRLAGQLRGREQLWRRQAAGQGDDLGCCVTFNSSRTSEALTSAMRRARRTLMSTSMPLVELR